MATQVNTPRPSALNILDEEIRKDHQQQTRVSNANTEEYQKEIENKRRQEAVAKLAEKEKDAKIREIFPTQYYTNYMAELTPEWVSLMQNVLTFVEEETMAEHTESYKNIVLSDRRLFYFPNQTISGSTPTHADNIRDRGLLPVAHQTTAYKILKWEQEQANGDVARMYSHNNKGHVYMSVAHPGKKVTFKYNSMNHTYDMGNRVPFIAFETLKKWKNSQQYKRHKEMEAMDNGSDTDSMGSASGILAVTREIDDTLERMKAPKIRTHERSITQQMYKLATISKEEMIKRKNKKLALLEPERMFVLDGGKCTPASFSKEAKDWLYDPRAKDKKYEEHRVPIKQDGTSFCVAPYTQTTQTVNGERRNLAQAYHPEDYHHMGDVAKAFQKQERGKGRADIANVTMAAAYDDMAFCASGSGRDNNECASDEKYDSPLGLKNTKISRKSNCQKDSGGICKPYWMNTKESPLYELYHGNNGDFVKSEISLGKKALDADKRKSHIDFNATDTKKSKSTRWSASKGSANKEQSVADLQKLRESLRMGAGGNKKPMIRRR
jgi:hypothetical protein